MSQATETAATTGSSNAKSALHRLQQYPPLIDLGKVKAKQSKRLRKGKTTSLNNEIAHSYDQVQAGVDGNTRPVIFSYEEKRKKKKNKGGNFFGMKVNRKKAKRKMKKNGFSPTFW